MMKLIVYRIIWQYGSVESSSDVQPRAKALSDDNLTGSGIFVVKYYFVEVSLIHKKWLLITLRKKNPATYVMF
jgi:hypothetical protein